MRKSAMEYAVAIVATVLAVGLRWIADPYLGDQLPLITLFGGIAVAAWFGGLRPGVLATVLGYLACRYLFISPRHSLEIATGQELIRTASFLFTSACIVVMGEAIRLWRRRFEDLSQRQEHWFARTPSAEVFRGRPSLFDPANLGFAAAAMILIFGGISGALNARQLVEQERWVAHTHQVIGELESLLSSINATDAGQREFLLSGNAAYLVPYHEGVSKIGSRLQSLRQLISDNPSQLARLSELKTLTERRLADLDREIGDSGQSGLPDVPATRSDSGEQAMTDIRRGVAELQDAERRLLERRAEESQQSYQITVISIALPAILGVILLGILLYLVQQRLLERRLASYLVSDERERFRVTLASIGDAVITTDIDGRVTYLNPVAEAATGWRVDEATGQGLASVFRIVNESTREPVDNPATRALREGRVVGLANHTILIRRDGSECPIDDSAAPIQDEEGRVTGCVLVFRDITVRKVIEKQNEEATAAARFLASIVGTSEDAIIAVSLTGMIQTWNGAAERLYGYTANEAIGKPVGMLIPEERADEEERLIARIVAGERISHFDTVRVKKSGERVDVSLTISAVKDDQDRIIGTSKVVRDITESKAAEKRIYGLMQDLEEADRRKDEFLAILAHELRGPLAPIRHSLEIIKRARGDNQIVGSASSTMDRQLTQMVRLVDDLLDVSRITSNKLELRREKIALADVLLHAVQLCEPLAESLGHQPVLDIEGGPIFVDGDPVRLTQIFGNLLQNAYKYTARGGTIRLSAKRHGSDVRVTVTDTGVGIPEELLPHVFELFIQVERNKEKAEGGLGIGLTLVKQLVSMHGGTVTAASDGPGRGSEFTVTLPIAAEDRKPGAATTSTSGHTGDVAREILVVDDNKDSVDSLAMLLRMAGHRIHVAYDGLEAYQAAERFKPELVLLDLGLPRLNGYETCRMIREQAWGQDAIIIALSGWGQEADRRKSEEAGFDRHLVKPIDYQSLLEMLTSMPVKGQGAKVRS